MMLTTKIKISATFQMMQTPERNENGVKLLYEYYNQLSFLERRMSSNPSLAATQFVWYAYLKLFIRSKFPHLKPRR